MENLPSPTTPSPTARVLSLWNPKSPSPGCSRAKLVIDAPRNLNPPLPRTPTSSGTCATPLSLLM